jgi:DNA-binding MarR family transcriptional regulator
MPDLRDTLEGLFVEAAIIEHLTRSRVQSKYVGGIEVGQFGILGYFTRNQQRPDTIAGLAWAFQEEEERITRQVQSLSELGYVTLTTGITPRDTMVAITEAGRMARNEALNRMGPDFVQLVAEIPVEDLETTHRTLREIRLVMDNLPDR